MCIYTDSALFLVVYNYTGKAGDPSTVNHVTISPSQPEKGENLTVIANVTLSKCTENLSILLT